LFLLTSEFELGGNSLPVSPIILNEHTQRMFGSGVAPVSLLDFWNETNFDVFKKTTFRAK